MFAVPVGLRFTFRGQICRSRTGIIRSGDLDLPFVGLKFSVLGLGFAVPRTEILCSWDSKLPFQGLSFFVPETNFAVPGTVFRRSGIDEERGVPHWIAGIAGTLCGQPRSSLARWMCNFPGRMAGNCSATFGIRTLRFSAIIHGREHRNACTWEGGRHVPASSPCLLARAALANKLFFTLSAGTGSQGLFRRHRGFSPFFHCTDSQGKE